MAFIYLKVKCAKCLCLLPVVLRSWSLSCNSVTRSRCESLQVSYKSLVSSVLSLGLVTLVLVLRIWSCLHHCFVTACFVTWSCHFGLGHGLGLVSSGLDLGLITLVLVMVLRIWTCLHHCFVTT